jgi:hypothetical protein
MKNHSAKRWISLLVVFSFLFTVSCSSFYPVSGTSPQQWSSAIEVGDTVQVTKKNGETQEFKVVRVTSDGIEGEGVQIAFDEIDSIQKEEISPGKTTGLVVGIIALVVVVIALVVSAAPSFIGSLVK